MKKMTKTTKTFITFLIVTTSLLAQESQSPEYKKAKAEIISSMGTVPEMFEALPDHMLASHWEWFKSYNSQNTVIPQKYAELIGLAVASQIPCNYCVYAHTMIAKTFGATEAEIKEAVAHAAKTRFLSTISNGFTGDFDEFRKEWDGILTYMKNHNDAKK